MTIELCVKTGMLWNFGTSAKMNVCSWTGFKIHLRS